MDITLGMSFLTLSNVEINFYDWKLSWRSYITTEVLFTTRQIELIRKKKFVTAALDWGDEVFVVHLASFNSDINIHPSCSVLITLLKIDETPTAIPSEYANFADIFSSDLITELSEYIKINNHAINLIEDK